MRKTIFIIACCLLVNYPLCAYEIDSPLSIEGTIWGHLHCSSVVGCFYYDQVGFYDGHIYRSVYQYGCFYRTSKSLPAGYIDLPGIGLFWYTNYCMKDQPLLCQRNKGLLYPTTGKGIRFCPGGISCAGENSLELLSFLSLPEDICNAVTDYMMTRDPQNDTECVVPTPTDKFYDDDEAAYCWVYSLASSPEDEYRCKWYKPNGELYHEEIIPFSDEVGCWYSSILINGDTPATTSGEWYVEVYLNGNKEFTKYFTIAASD